MHPTQHRLGPVLVCLILTVVLSRCSWAHGTLNDVSLAMVVAPGQHAQRAQAAARLIWEIRRRTSIAMAPKPELVAFDSPELFKSPLLIWQGAEKIAPLSELSIANLRRYLALGGSLFIDASDAETDSPFAISAWAEVARAFADIRPVPLDGNHVFYKSFYLLHDCGGRKPTTQAPKALMLDGRLAVIGTTNDLLGAMATDVTGAYVFTAETGENGRELSVRCGINWAMYALCTDYKDDQVHLPFILRRRQ